MRTFRSNIAKNGKTYTGNLLTMSHIFFVFESCYWRYKDEHDVFIFLKIKTKSPPTNQTLGIITPPPWGLPPNPEDLRPFPPSTLQVRRYFIAAGTFHKNGSFGVNILLFYF